MCVSVRSGSGLSVLSVWLRGVKERERDKPTDREENKFGVENETGERGRETDMQAETKHMWG